MGVNDSLHNIQRLFEALGGQMAQGSLLNVDLVLKSAQIRVHQGLRQWELFGYVLHLII